MQIILSLILHPEIAGASAPQRERERAGMTGTGRVLTAVSFMGPVTISSCSEIRETEREGEKQRICSHKVYEVQGQVKKRDTQGRAE